MNSIQGGDEIINCNVNISLPQESSDAVRNRGILEDDNDVITYQQKKRLKKGDLSDLLKNDLESSNKDEDSFLGNSLQIESSLLVQSVEFEPVCAEVVQKTLDESLHCSSEFQRSSLKTYDGTLIGKTDDTGENGDAVTHYMLFESMDVNGKVLNVESTATDTVESPEVASRGAHDKDFLVHLGIKEQCLSTPSTTERKSLDSDLLVNDHLKEHQDEAKEIVSVVDGNALGRLTPLYNEEQSAASHAELSLEQLNSTQGVTSQAVCEGISVQVDRAFAGYKHKKLLVLDVNGLLVDISSYVPYNYEPDDIIMKKAVFRRPHCDDFLNFCFEKFNVGFWTSRTKRNLEPVLDFLLGNSKSRLLFYWDQSHCTDTGFYTIEKRDKPLLLKKLKKLWEKREPGLPWERGVYNESNTLLLDDTPCKALSNPPYTAVFPYTYHFRHVRDNSLGPGGDLRVYLEGLAEAENVQEYVKKNPFGQRPITEKNLSWGFFRKVIKANSTPPRQTDTDDP